MHRFCAPRHVGVVTGHVLPAVSPSGEQGWAGVETLLKSSRDTAETRQRSRGEVHGPPKHRALGPV